MNIPEIIDVHFIQPILTRFSAPPQKPRHSDHPSMNPHVSHEKEKNFYYHCTGLLIGILMMDNYNPSITG